VAGLPAGLLEGSRLLDAPSHHVSVKETIQISKNYEFQVLFTSTVGWENDQRLAMASQAYGPIAFAVLNALAVGWLLRE
jgi:hypothetical protein